MIRGSSAYGACRHAGGEDLQGTRGSRARRNPSLKAPGVLEQRTASSQDLAQQAVFGPSPPHADRNGSPHADPQADRAAISPALPMCEPSWHRRELNLELERQGSRISYEPSLLSGYVPRGPALAHQRPVECYIAESNGCARLFESRAEQLDPQTRSSSSSRGQASRGGWQAAITGCFASTTRDRRQVPQSACRDSARPDDAGV